VKVNPFGAIKELGKHSTSAFDAFVKVGPPIPGVLPITFPASGNPTTPGTSLILFPFPFSGASSPPITTTPTTPILTLNNTGTFTTTTLAKITHPARRPTAITTGTGTTQPLGTGVSLTGRLGGAGN
jgi:hypothetical protein